MKKEYTIETIEAAKIAAKEMIINGNPIERFQFGQEDGFLWVTDQKEMVIDPFEFEVDGSIFFVGLFKKP